MHCVQYDLPLLLLEVLLQYGLLKVNLGAFEPYLCGCKVSLQGCQLTVELTFLVYKFLVDVILTGALLYIPVLNLIQFVPLLELAHTHLSNVTLCFGQLGIDTVQLVFCEELERLETGELGAELLVHVGLRLELLVEVVDLLLQVPVRHRWSEVHLKTNLALLGLLFGDELVDFVHLLRPLHNWHFFTSCDVELPIARLFNRASRVGLRPAEVPILAEQVVLDHKVPRYVVDVSQLGATS